MAGSAGVTIQDRCERPVYDAVVVGSGPNGLAAAITLARANRSVVVLEAEETIGGGCRSAELTLPGFVHDRCSAIHPLGVGSPFFQDVPLHEYGLEWVFPPVQLAHPFDDGTAVALDRSVALTAESMGGDARAYRALMDPLVSSSPKLVADLLGPPRLPRYPLADARLGAPGVLPATWLARLLFRQERARGFLAGLAAHSMLPLDRPATSAFGLVLGMLGHAVGWPVARGGSQRIADAMAAYLRSLGGEILAGARVESIDQAPEARAVLFDVTPRQLLRIAGHRLPARYRRALERFRYGPGAFKVDFALDGPVPWTAEAPRRAATVHLGATLEEIAASEAAMGRGVPPERPFVLAGQQSLIDPTRAPTGKHTLWAYCHVPNSSTFDMTERIERQIERFAPGFRNLVLARHVGTPADLEAHNANYIGGDIGAGAGDLRQILARPVFSLIPYATPARGVYLCSASTPPGAGVHGLCGYFAARAAIADMDGLSGLRRLLAWSPSGIPAPAHPVSLRWPRS